MKTHDCEVTASSRQELHHPLANSTCTTCARRSQGSGKPSLWVILRGRFCAGTAQSNGPSEQNADMGGRSGLSGGGDEVMEACAARAELLQVLTTSMKQSQSAGAPGNASMYRVRAGLVLARGIDSHILIENLLTTSKKQSQPAGAPGNASMNRVRAGL